MRCLQSTVCSTCLIGSPLITSGKSFCGLLLGELRVCASGGSWWHYPRHIVLIRVKDIRIWGTWSQHFDSNTLGLMKALLQLIACAREDSQMHLPDICN